MSQTITMNFKESSQLPWHHGRGRSFKREKTNLQSFLIRLREYSIFLTGNGGGHNKAGVKRLQTSMMLKVLRTSSF
jgi:hypothetical protein